MPPDDPKTAKLLDALVRPGGSGTAEDVAAVRDDVRKLPPSLLAFFKKKKVRILACRGSVTDVEVSLRNVTPRGWEGTGRTWDSVPGTFLSRPGRVVIATVRAPGGGRQVTPRSPDTHGAYNLTIHESVHGYDYSSGHAVLADPRFQAARDADFPNLGDYERQAGRAGLEETFAESAARHYGGDGGFAGDWPNLALFWAGDPLDWSEAPAGEAPPLPQDPDAPIGAASILEDGSLVLDLRAEGPNGEVGHAALRFPVEDAAHARVYRHVFGDQELAFGAPARGLFRPMTREPR